MSSRGDARSLPVRRSVSLNPQSFTSATNEFLDMNIFHHVCCGWGTFPHAPLVYNPHSISWSDAIRSLLFDGIGYLVLQHGEIPNPRALTRLEFFDRVPNGESGEHGPVASVSECERLSIFCPRKIPQTPRLRTIPLPPVNTSARWAETTSLALAKPIYKENNDQPGVSRNFYPANNSAQYIWV